MHEERPQFLSEEEINAAVLEYELNVDAVAAEFKERTKLQDADAAFVVFATALQVLRIVLVQLLRPEEQSAGQGNVFEEKLHDIQSKVLERFDNPNDVVNYDMRASIHHIVTNRGVPYDATAFLHEKLDLFKGANHRFSTLGHDPLLGLIFGTGNILTNTITTLRKPSLLKVPVILTHPVVYDSFGKNPKIASTPLAPKLTFDMVHASCNRLRDDKAAVVAAFIKQLIHIGTDVYTTKGIQLPLSGLVLSNASVEKLTDYVGMADLVEFGASAGLATLINWLIAALHGCTFVFNDDGTDYCSELYQARTRKILSLSNAIATSSNLIAAAVKPDVVRVDFGGLAVTLFRLISDTAFITKLKYEYLNSEVSKIYEARGEGLVESDWLDENACLERMGLK